MHSNLKIVSRESRLAMWQANHVQGLLQSLTPNLSVSIIGVTTQGDKQLDISLNKIGGKGLFIKELETKLLDGEADLAVHCVKDMPYELPKGLTIAAVLPRGEVLDCLVAADKSSSLANLPAGAKIGTSSLRRQAQLLAHRSDLNIVPIRGNLGTRINKIATDRLDGIILAAAGLIRLSIQQHITQLIPAEICLPAVGQGALALQCRTDDSATIAMVRKLNCAITERCISAERALTAELEGSCHSPIAGYAQLVDDKLSLEGYVGSLDGKQRCYSRIVASSQDPLELGVEVAKDLLEQGAKDLIQVVK